MGMRSACALPPLCPKAFPDIKNPESTEMPESTVVVDATEAFIVHLTVKCLSQH